MISNAAWAGSIGTSRLSERSLAREFRVCGGQQARQAFGPGGLARRVVDLVLADLDLDMRQAAPLAMHRDGVVGQIVTAVGLVIADDETVFGAQQFE